MFVMMDRTKLNEQKKEEKKNCQKRQKIQKKYQEIIFYTTRKH